MGVPQMSKWFEKKGTDDDVVVSSRVRLARNVKGVPFPGRMDEKQAAGMLDRVQEELLQGAYTEQTPAAIVYKATWPDQKVVRCTVGTLAESAAREGISKTALILVGDFLGEHYERSLLYHPQFTTEFRKGTPE